MADNVTLNAGTGGAVMATDDIAGVHHQKVKVEFGASDSATQVSSSDPLPVVQTGALPAGDNNIGNVDVVTLPALPAGTNNIGDVDVLSLPALPAGTNNIGDVDVLTLPGVAGDVAHDSGDSGNPVKIGARAVSALPTAVATTDRANALADLFGRILTAEIDPAMQIWKSFNATTTQTGIAIWTPTSGKKWVITSMFVSFYGTTAGRCIIWSGASGDTTYNEGTDQAVYKVSAAPTTGSKPGAVITPRTPIFATTADHVLKITTDAALSVDVVVYGYEI